MNIQQPKVIGEGSYGCVHSPSLECDAKKTDISYENKVSKILPQKEARIELSEYVLISNADKDKKFYLGEPDICDVNKNNSNLIAFSKCNLAKDKKYTDLSDFKLLVMPNGGINLADYAEKVKGIRNTPENVAKIEMFWIEAKRLFLGLKTFLKHDLLHHDLKPQNIVYDETKNRLNYIDFGLMEKKSESIKKCAVSKYGFSSTHWSFPFETAWINKQTWIKNRYLPDADKMRLFEKFLKSVSAQRVDFIETFFLFTLQDNDREEPIQYMKDYFDFFMHYKEINKTEYIKQNGANALTTLINREYNEFLEKYFNTIDIYGVGIALLYVLKNAKHLMRPVVVEEFHKLFYSMVQPNIFKRVEIDELINKYNIVLYNTGIWSNHNKKEIKEEKNIVELIKIKEEIKEIIPDNYVESIREKKEEILRNSDKTPIRSFDNNDDEYGKKCPEGKIINPKTGRCIKIRMKNVTEKKCPEGKVLNPTTNRCVKIAIKKNVTEKKCPDGKVLNPTTNRCVKIAIKKNITEKKCPDGKVLNFVTGRCIKIKNKK